MDIHHDQRIVMTLDAGGTNLVFSAIQGGQEAITPITLPSEGHDLDACLGNIRKGFERISQSLERPPVAISFAFPGPADYPNGIIGDLNNLPAFRGGVALGPMLEGHFGIPTFINNDGDLFVYGEAIAGLLPEVNRALEQRGNPKRFQNLFGVVLGTGFGGGFVNGGRLYRGDNAAAAEIWCTRNKLDSAWTAEEGVSIRAVKHAYASQTGISFDQCPEPRQIHQIARGEMEGDAAAARAAFRRLGEVAGETLANISALLDCLIVVGGGLAGAGEFILPALVEEMNKPMHARDGRTFPRTEVQALNLEDAADRDRFFQGEITSVQVPGTGRRVAYDPMKRIGVGLTRLGTSHATSIGAYAFALEQLDQTRAKPLAIGIP